MNLYICNDLNRIIIANLEPEQAPVSMMVYSLRQKSKFRKKLREIMMNGVNFSGVEMK